jgi:hypothetical protein
MKRIGPFIICLGALVFFLASKEQKTQFKEKEVQKTYFQLSSQERPY